VSDRLLPAKPDDVMLVQEVHARWREVEGLHQRLRGVPLLIPGALAPATLRFRSVFSRFLQGDYRQTESEKKAVREIAQWLVNTNAELRGVTPTVIQWVD